MKKKYPSIILGSLLISFATMAFNASAQQKDIAYYTSRAPFTMPAVATPVLKDRTFSITDFGAISDGKTLNTTAFAKAIQACTDAGGGKVLVPEGTWLTGTIELKNNVDLHTLKGAVIQFTADHTQYPMIKMGESSSFVTASPIYAYNASNIAITGEGIIDGAGESWRPVKKSKVAASLWSALIKKGVLSADGKIWWPSKDAMDGEEYVKTLKDKSPAATANDYEKARDFLRPYMVYFIRCKTILIEGVTLRNSPKFVFYPNRCSNLTMNGVNVFNDWWAQNGDGIDISACKNVVIYNCTLSVGDDGICMKSSRGSDAADSAALKNILVARCTVYRAHGGFVIGSNTDGGMENIYVADCNFIGSDIGIRIKSNTGRGGLVKAVYIDGITMKDIKNEAILFTTFYEDMPAGKTAKDAVEKDADKVPRFTDFHLSNIECEGAATAISITGLQDMPVSNLHFNNMKLTARAGLVATDATDISLKNVILNTSTPLFTLKRTNNIVSDGKPVE